MACDDAVLRSAAPRAYAMNLAQIAEAVTRRSARILPSLLGGHSQLGRRIEHILSGRKDSNRSGRGPLLGAALGLLAMCALLVQSPVLVAFQARSETAPIQSAVVHAEGPAQATLTPAALHLSSPRPVRHISPRAHRPHVSHSSPRLLATAGHTLLPGKRQSDPLQPAVLQPAALLVLWNDPRGGFSATLVFAAQPCSGKPSAMQPRFFLLQI
jgi:hypothetical protein